MRQFVIAVVGLLALIANTGSAFAPRPSLQQPIHTSHARVGGIATAPAISTTYQPASLQRQRKSVAQVQIMGLFGLGAPEIGIILVAAAFLLGPEKLASLGRDAGKIAGELKEVPKEFQAGLAEGEAAAKAIKDSSTKDAEVVKKETIE
jgi:sec-independent protein translocase protein TatA